LFYRFKFGNVALTFPFALGMYEALRQRELFDFDCIVPVPLSPDKAKRGEVHRTLLLARALHYLLGADVTELLKLTADVSKRRLLSLGGTQVQFEVSYLRALRVVEGISSLNRILLVDDVCTRGSTLTCALNRILAAYPACKVVAATAAQMIIKWAIKDEAQLLQL
jgi:predicted amidophosphoribosyltransferase